MAFKPPRAGGLFAARETSTPMMKPPATTFSARRTPQGPDKLPRVGMVQQQPCMAILPLRSRRTGHGSWCVPPPGWPRVGEGKWQEGVAFSQHAHAQASRARMRERMCTHMCALALSCSVVHPCVLDPVLPSTRMPPDGLCGFCAELLYILPRVQSGMTGLCRFCAEFPVREPVLRCDFWVNLEDHPARTCILP